MDPLRKISPVLRGRECDKIGLQTGEKGEDMAKKSALPFSYERFRKEFPEIEKEYDHLARKCHAGGPLNEKMRRMIKLGIAIGSESEGAIKSHARRAMAIGVSPEEIRHAVLLGLTTIGFPKMIAALNLVHEAFEEGPTKNRRGD
jgi:4-carboxymuconolactone decarboxylase